LLIVVATPTSLRQQRRLHWILVFLKDHLRDDDDDDDDDGGGGGGGGGDKTVAIIRRRRMIIVPARLSMKPVGFDTKGIEIPNNVNPSLSYNR